MRFELSDFVIESNRIEGIAHSPRLLAEIDATAAFLAHDVLNVTRLVDLVKVYQPDALPRFRQGLDVRVGNHIPPRGGPHIMQALGNLLEAIQTKLDAYDGHVAYETLHPFTDGNGRSGRAVWLWRMGGIEKAPLGFLHHFYYQALQHSRDGDGESVK